MIATSNRRRRRRAGSSISLVLIAAAAVAVSGCGSSSAATNSNKQDANRLAAAKCLRAHGLNVPDPGSGQRGGFRALGQNTPPAKLQAAFQACRKYIQGAFGNATPAQRAAFRDAFVTFAACMRKQGINLPDPGANGGPGGGARIFTLRQQPGFQAAARKCQSLLPQSPGGGGGVRVFGGGGPPPGGAP